MLEGYLYIGRAGENKVHKKFLYSVCKNMWLGSIDTKLQTVPKCSAKGI